jgi:hypothetical protein
LGLRMPFRSVREVGRWEDYHRNDSYDEEEGDQVPSQTMRRNVMTLASPRIISLSHTVKLEGRTAETRDLETHSLKLPMKEELFFRQRADTNLDLLYYTNSLSLDLWLGLLSRTDTSLLHTITFSHFLHHFIKERHPEQRCL